MKHLQPSQCDLAPNGEHGCEQGRTPVRSMRCLSRVDCRLNTPTDQCGRRHCSPGHQPIKHPAEDLKKLLVPLGGVLNYRTVGTAGVGRTCGQASGSSDDGAFCLLIKGIPEQAQAIAKTYLCQMESRGYKITGAVFTPSSDLPSFYGNPVNTFRSDEVDSIG